MWAGEPADSTTSTHPFLRLAMPLLPKPTNSSKGKTSSPHSLQAPTLFRMLGRVVDCSLYERPPHPTSVVPAFPHMPTFAKAKQLTHTPQTTIQLWLHSTALRSGVT